MRRPVLVGSAALALLAGCSSSSEGGDAPTFTVPATQAVPDDSYVLQGTALVTTEEYDDGPHGYVTIPARRGASESNRAPILQGLLTLDDGETVPCSMPRGIIWSTFDDFVDLELKCETNINLATASAFTIE